MKKVILSLLASIALPSAVNTEVYIEVYKFYNDVKGYIGCVKNNIKREFWNLFNGKSLNLKSNKREANLYVKKVKKCLPTNEN